MGLEDHLHGFLARYIAAPQWMRSVLGRAYVQLPKSWRHGSAYGRFSAEAACRDEALIAHLAAEKLKCTLRAAISAVPAFSVYHDLLANIENPYRTLAQLPLTAKEDIKRDPARYRSGGPIAARGLRTFTGGSTAQPLEFLLERHVSRPKETAYVDAIHRDLLGMRDADRTLSLHGRTVASAAREGGRLWMYEPVKRQLILSSDHLERRYMSEYLNVLRRHRPRQIHAYPSALLPLANWLAEEPCPEFSEGVTGILLTSENIYAHHLEAFRVAFPQARIVKHYGHSERVLMAVSLDDEPDYRFPPLYGHLELVDLEGQPVLTPGVLGEIVGTSFDNGVMPFIRYRTGDLGIFGGSGTNGQLVLRSIEGRLQEFIVCRDRRLVSVTTLGAAHFSELAAADYIQYEQREPGLVDLKVVAQRPLETSEILRIERAVREKTQGGCAVRVQRVRHIERTARGKHRMLVQHLDLSDFLGASALHRSQPQAVSTSAG